MQKTLLSSLIKAVLAEDLGQNGDITSLATIPAEHQSSAVFVARSRGVVAGLDVAAEVFRQVDPSVRFEVQIEDGALVETQTVFAKVGGNTRALLAGERTALNFLSHLSGIANATRELVDLVAYTSAKITDTRKTTPGLRDLEKYAVRMGGGVNHRFGLYDAVLIKDNHIAALGGDVELAARSAKNYLSENGSDENIQIIVEVDHLAQIESALRGGANRLLLDNMTPDQLREAVAKINGRALAEASGGVTRDTVKAIAESGVDFISVGAITHSAPILDIGLDWN